MTNSVHYIGILTKKKLNIQFELNMKTKKLSIYACLAIGMMSLLSSCKTPQDVAYFQDFDKIMTVETQARQAIVVKPEDKLQIIVHSKDPQLSSLFNLPVVTSRLGQNASTYGGVSAQGMANTSEGLASYTVSSDGTIEFPVLGKLYVEGMTREQLAGFIKGELMGRNLIKDPSVTVEFLNTGISILGEVKAPGRYLVNRDEITVLDALAMAGDLTVQGRRDNIRVLRKENGKTQVYLLNIIDGKNFYNSPGFYLKQDDVLYVEPNDIRKRETTVNGNTSLSASFWMSVVSVLTSVAVLVVNITRK